MSLEKEAALAGGVQQRDAQLRPRDLQHESGKTCARTHVDPLLARGGMCNQEDSERGGHMLPDHQGRIRDRERRLSRSLRVSSSRAKACAAASGRPLPWESSTVRSPPEATRDPARSPAPGVVRREAAAAPGIVSRRRRRCLTSDVPWPVSAAGPTRMPVRSPAACPCSPGRLSQGSRQASAAAGRRGPRVCRRRVHGREVAGDGVSVPSDLPAGDPRCICPAGQGGTIRRDERPPGLTSACGRLARS